MLYHRGKMPMVNGIRRVVMELALKMLQAHYYADLSQVMAGVFVSVLPLLVLFVVAGRQLVSGIMQGAVKG